MNVVAVVVEYNPPHLGHLYQLNKIKEKFGKNSFIILIMTGDFCQRGVPSLFDKETKAKLGINLGADLVILLPSQFTLSSAGNFAEGSLKILEATGLTLNWVFGAEEENLDLLKSYALAELHFEGSIEFKEELKKYLKKGYSYPRSYSLAIYEVLKEEKTQNLKNFDLDTYLSKRKEANNILAIEYIKAWLKLERKKKTVARKISLTLIKREGQAYRSEETNLNDGAYASASALRNYLLKERYLPLRQQERNLYSDEYYTKNDESHLKNFTSKIENIKSKLLNDSFLKQNLPPVVLNAIYQDLCHLEISGSALLHQEQIAHHLLLSVLGKSVNELKIYANMNEEKAQRLSTLVHKKLNEFTSLENFYQEWAKKNYTSTSCARGLLSILLNLTAKNIAELQQKEIESLLILSLSKRGKYLLKKMKKYALVPLSFSSHDKSFALDKKLSFFRILLLNKKINEHFKQKSTKSFLVD